jgi:predicted nucleotidyltransferase
MDKNFFSSGEKKALLELKKAMKNLAGGHTKLILFGSRARRDYGCESDVDIAIIVRGLNKELKNAILEKVAGIEIKYLTPLSTLVISDKDFAFLKRRERRIALDIQREGISL